MATEPPAGGHFRDVRTADEFRVYARSRLIESRLTPNAISLTGFVLNLAAAGLGDFELLAPAVYVIAALTAITAVQRVWHVRGELRRIGAV